MSVKIQGYDQVIKEYFDITHNETRKVLLSIDESDQNQVLTNLTSKLYDHIVTKVDDIDFGTIPNSKGDITKLDNYDNLIDCVRVMHDILVEYKQDTTPINTIEKAISNIRSRKELFEKGFRYNVEFIMVTYSSITLAIVSSISFMISSCIDFIKSPSEETFNIIIDKGSLIRTKQNMLFTNLTKFNAACDRGQIDSGLEYILKNGTKGTLTESVTGVVASGLVVITILLNILPIIRELIFFFYYSRVRVSDYFDIQADLLQMNAYNVKSNDTMNKAQRDKISKKQFTIVDLFRKISRKIAISNKECEVKATKEISSTNKKYKTTDLSDTLPDSAASALF